MVRRVSRGFCGLRWVVAAGKRKRFNMFTKKRFSSLKTLDLLVSMKGMLSYHDHYWGIVALVVVLALLAALAGMRSGPVPNLFLAGEIAQHDVIADRDIQVEDAQATQARRNQLLAHQPLIFDLDVNNISSFRDELLTLFHNLNLVESHDAEIQRIADSYNKAQGTDLPLADFRILANPEVQAYALANTVPWLEDILSEGVLADMRQLSTMSNAVIIRDSVTNNEILRTQAGGLHDLRSLQVVLGQNLRTASELRPAAKSVLLDIIPPLLAPTLYLNQDATMQRNVDILHTVEPVYYRVQRGEIIVRAGAQVTHEQQLKIQSLIFLTRGGQDWQISFGSFVLSVLLCLGLFMTPSGNKGTVLHTKDQMFIAFLLLIFGLAAWGYSRLLLSAMGNATATATAMAFAFPVSGAAGLSALIFSARRYCAIGLLLTMFSTVFLGGNFALFLFFFLSAMFNTWLVLRSQNRQDVVWSTLPLFAWLLFSGLGAGWINHLTSGQMPTLILALGLNAMFSVFLLFALSPIMEMVMGFTTRFRLMELMNLEQPLLQEIMMTSPGTYHHSLLVSYLVEAAAASMGANSLLCKVGALYHDIGKLQRPDYFFENQFGGPNPHDNLQPSMSALVIGSHVKHGIEIAHAHKLGREIESIISQHHGTRCISFFYQKAIASGEKPRIEDFSYNGPKPQSREAAIVMIADVVEASSRTMIDPTPARIQTHVNGIIKGIYAEGQLDDSDLTFKNLTKITDSMVRVLIGLFHKRIAYPDSGLDKEVKLVKNGDNGTGELPQNNKNGEIYEPNQPRSCDFQAFTPDYTAGTSHLPPDSKQSDAE